MADYTVNGNTYTFPDDYTPDKVQDILSQQGIIKSQPRSFLQNLGESGKGFAKGLGRDLLNSATDPIAQITPLAPVAYFLNESGLTERGRQATEPTNTPQKVGSGLETLGTFLLPGGEEAEGVAGIVRGAARKARSLLGSDAAKAAKEAGTAAGAQAGALAGDALHHPAADIAAHVIPGGPLMLRIARMFGKEKLMSRDDAAIELFKRTYGKSPKGFVEQTRARAEFDRFAKNIEDSMKPPKLGKDAPDLTRSQPGKLNVYKAKPEPTPKAGPDLTRSQPSKHFDIAASQGKASTKAKISKVKDAEKAAKEAGTRSAGYQESPHPQPGLSSRELNPGKVINAQSAAKTQALAKRFKGIGMTPEQVSSMTEAEYNAHRVEENAVRKAQGLPLMDPVRPGPNRRNFAELKADIVQAMRSLP